jgi:hypothetical protein
LTFEQTENMIKWFSERQRAAMSSDRLPRQNPLEESADQAVAACGGDPREAVKALIVANDFLQAQVDELQASVSSGYARGYHHGRWKTYSG